ncbi:hypothetical protein CFC21_084674 [Triticum aestivum]|uniref:Uncharacterized protein n=3 Tax=Triticum TaxID=4564 RepID=A0A9R1IAG8_WHEAT|nr:hypothetical protein CFC21_084673 [Triticum aestivum]KAF7080622.1 hypothetical protein CFC21_084674 [Triticum aestivum]VAI49927.1 unnamed protein product [Triticum turgidum subsp. durum]
MKLRRCDAGGHADVKPQHCKDAGREAMKVKDAKPLDRGTTKSGATKPQRCVAGGRAIAKFGPLYVPLIPVLVFCACRLHDIFRRFGLMGKPLLFNRVRTEFGMWRSCRRGFEEGLI